MTSMLISGLISVLQQPGLMPAMEEERRQLLELFMAILPLIPDAKILRDELLPTKLRDDGLVFLVPPKRPHADVCALVETWRRDLYPAAYEVDAIVDEFRYATFRAEAETNRHQSSGNKLRTSVFSLCKLISGIRLPFIGRMNININEDPTSFIEYDGFSMVRERLIDIVIKIRYLVDEIRPHFLSPQGQRLMPCAEGQQDPTLSLITKSWQRLRNSEWGSNSRPLCSHSPGTFVCVTVPSQDPILSSLEEIEPIIVGRDQHKEDNLPNFLNLSHDVGHTIAVFTFIGKQGIGKSTFARFICSDTRIKDNFEVILWVDVGVELNAGKIAKSVIDQIIGKDCCLSEGDMDLLGHRINQELSGKRYLLVLDDFQDQKHGSSALIKSDMDLLGHRINQEWKQLKSWLQQSSAIGSSLIITSRYSIYFEEGWSHKEIIVRPLREKELLTLFYRRACIADKENYPKVREISQLIFQGCLLSPLLVNLMGGLVRFKKDDAELQEVLKKLPIYENPDRKLLNLGIIELCINDLSSEIKECFLFCSLFPEGYYMDKEVLVKLWMANGLISFDGPISVEEKGNRIFNELTLRHLFEDVKHVIRSPSKDKHGYRSRVICTMHSIIHDVARCFSRDDYIVLPESLFVRQHDCFPGQYHGVSILGDLTKNIHVSLKNCPHLRTLIFLDGPFKRYVNCNFLPKSNSLRTLHLHSALFVGDLFELKYTKHLRYLDLSGSRIRRLPESTSSLYFLQTLNLSKCLLLCRLPEDMRYMRSLRHLYVDGCPKLKEMPLHLRQLSDLKTLTTYIVGESIGNGIDEIKFLDLCGLLEIYNLCKVRKAEIAKEGEGRQGSEAGVNYGGPSGAHNIEADCGGAQEGVTSSSTPFYEPRVTLSSTPPTMRVDEVDLDTDMGASEQKGEPLYTPQQRFCSNVGGDSTGSTDLGENLYLFSKTNLDRLTLCWGRQPLVLSKENNDYEVLEALRPHSGLKVLKIQQYGGHEFTNWLAYPVGLPNLVELHLIGCSQCSNIPAMRKLRSLQVLCLKYMINLTSFYSLPDIDEKDSSELFPRLKRLVLVGLKRMERWHEGEAIQRTILSFPVLDEMEISNCPELITMPIVPMLKYLTIRIENHGLLPSVIDLITQSEGLVEVNMAQESSFDNESFSALGAKVDRHNSHKLRVMRLDSTNSFFMDKAIPHLQLGFWGSLVSLENLDIFNCSSIVDWPLEEFRNLGKLKRLSMRMCPNLNGLLPSQLHERKELLPLLQSLEFYRCLSLKEIPKCSSIVYLELDECPEIKSISDLNNLKMLFLSCTSWTSLPTGLGNLEKLESLRVSECYSLTSLPDELAGLTSLQTLIINKCSRVKSLPEGLDEMLSGLGKFQISECSDLEKFCQEEPYSFIISQIGKTTNNSAEPSTSTNALRYTAFLFYFCNGILSF